MRKKERKKGLERQSKKNIICEICVVLNRSKDKIEKNTKFI